MAYTSCPSCGFANAPGRTICKSCRLPLNSTMPTANSPKNEEVTKITRNNVAPHTLAEQGIAALKVDNKIQAAELLKKSLLLDPDQELAWLWLSGAVLSPGEQKFCLQNVTRINPQNQAAKRGLDSLPANIPAISPFPIQEISHKGTISRSTSINDATIKKQIIFKDAMSSTVVYEMKGVAVILMVYEDKVTITPKGVLGFMTKGLAGTKTIPFGSITGIQFKEAGAVFSGYIQFTIPGGNESKGGVFSAASDENTFMFAEKKNNELAEKIKKYIESAVLKLRTPQHQTSAPSLSDELQKLARLREQGILSDEEFQSAKKKLIG